jgi:hypothetical protein
MQNCFYNELNKNTLDAIKKDIAFFVKPGEVRIPIINNSFTGHPITGANYFNLKLANDLNGTSHTEYVKMNEVLASKSDWVSKIPQDVRPRGTLYQEENNASNSRYSFVMPTAELNQNIFSDNPDISQPRKNYVPFQTNETDMKDLGGFVREQFTNAINASFTGTPYKSNAKENKMDSFKTMLVDAIKKNPDFMAEIANQAYQDVMDFHYVPFDKKNFIEKARMENSNEFSQLSSAIANHVEDMYNSKKPSFNREFNELAQPLIINIENLHIDNSNKKTIIGRETTEFVRQKIMQEKPASILADTFAGTFVEKAIKLAKVGKKIFAGVALACSLINPDLSQAGKNIVESLKPNGISITMNKDEFQKNMGLNQTVDFVKTVVDKIGGGIDARSGDQPDKFVKIAETIIASQALKGDNGLSSCHDSGNAHSLFSRLNQTIRDNPQALNQAISQLNAKQSHKVHSGAFSHR